MSEIVQYAWNSTLFLNILTKMMKYITYFRVSIISLIKFYLSWFLDMVREANTTVASQFRTSSTFISSENI